jgi:hypothetical protein
MFLVLILLNFFPVSMHRGHLGTRHRKTDLETIGIDFDIGDDRTIRGASFVFYLRAPFHRHGNESGKSRLRSSHNRMRLVGFQPALSATLCSVDCGNVGEMDLNQTIGGPFRFEEPRSGLRRTRK